VVGRIKNLVAAFSCKTHAWIRQWLVHLPHSAGKLGPDAKNKRISGRFGFVRGVTARRDAGYSDIRYLYPFGGPIYAASLPIR
jgi:hypothetical protein